MNKSFKLIFTAYSFLIASAFFIATPNFAAPQPPSDAPPPPKADPANGDEPVTNLGKSNVKQTTQNFQEGDQPEVKVTNGLGTYIVKPNERVGTSLPGDGQSNSNNPVQWVVKSWGGDKSTTVKDDAPPTLQPNPDAPAAK
jgi:hypothetical protein